MDVLTFIVSFWRSYNERASPTYDPFGNEYVCLKQVVMTSVNWAICIRSTPEDEEPEEKRQEIIIEFGSGGQDTSQNNDNKSSSATDTVIPR